MTLTADIIAAIVKADDEAPVMGQVLDPGETVTFRVAGVQGETGPQGKEGPQGFTGPRGFDGEIGVMGPSGVEGKEGPVGPEGPQGAPGKVGAKGIKGDTGDTGPEGPAGKDGRAGRDGSVVMTRMAAGAGGGGGGGGAALSDAVPLVESGAGAAGAAGAASRGDHVHPADPGGGAADLVGAATTRTIAAGVIDVAGLHYVVVEGEGSADDVLDEITGGVDGQLLVIESAGQTITIGFGTNTVLVNQEANSVQIGNFVTQAFAVYSATDGNWQVWSNQVSRSIMSESGGTEIIARDAGGGGASALDFYVESDPIQRLDSAGIGWFTKASDTVTAPQQNADTIDELWTGLKAYGLLDTGSTSPGAGGLSGSAQTYTESNVTTDRTFNANATTIDELADVLGTLIADLRNRGVVN